MANKGFTIYESAHDPIGQLTTHQKGELLEAIMRYQADGMDPMAKVAYLFLKEQQPKTDLEDRQTCVYCIRMKSKDEEFIKIGISWSIHKRMEELRASGYDISIIWTELYDYRGEAFKRENELHELHRIHKYKPNKPFGGHTECFTMEILMY